MSGAGVFILIPLVPPSVNHYKVRARHGHTYVTGEALAFKAAVASCASPDARDGKLWRGLSSHHRSKLRYELSATVYLGKRGKGDGDNFWKVIGDGLKEAGVIHSDAAVKRWVMQVERDWENPRTEITVRVI